MKSINLGRKGQIATVDVIFVFIVVALYAAALWSFTAGSKAAETQGQRARQDFTKSLLLTLLYTTPDTEDVRYKGKSLSDLFGMYLANPEDVEKELIMKKLEEAKIDEYMSARGGGGGVKWFIYTEKGGDINMGALTPVKREFCFFNGGQNGEIMECLEEKTPAYRSTSASATIVYPKGSSSVLGSGSAGFEETPIYFSIIWEGVVQDE